MSYERIKHECDLAIKELQKNYTPEEIDMDIQIWTCLKEAIPELLMRLSEGGVLSNMTSANMAADIITRAINGRTLGAPIHTIEDAPYEWLDDGQDIEKSMAFLESLYGTENEDGYMLQNRRCSSIFYDPHTKQYSDNELMDGCHNDLTGVAWVGRPFDQDYAKAIMPLIYDRLDMGRFHCDGIIHSFPYYPVSQHRSIPATWEEECVWDFLSMMQYVSFKDIKPKITPNTREYTPGIMTGYICLIKFKCYDGEECTYMLYVMPLPHWDEKGKSLVEADVSCVVHLMPYTLPYNLDENALEIIRKSHMNFMSRYVPDFTARTLLIYPSTCNLLEPEDNIDSMFTFFMPIDELPDNEELGYLQPGYDYEYPEVGTVRAVSPATADTAFRRFYDCKIFLTTTPADVPRYVPSFVSEKILKVYGMICRHDDMCKQRCADINAAVTKFNAETMADPSYEKEDPTSLKG